MGEENINDLKELFKDDFFKQSMELFNHPINQEMNSQLNVELPHNVRILFSKSVQLYDETHGIHNEFNDNPFEIVKKRDSKRDNAQHFFNLFQTGIQNSLKAVQYNLNSFCNYATYIRNQGEKLIRTSSSINSGTTLAIPTEKLIFEYEHFTLHSRIVLDRLNWFFNYFFVTNPRNLYKLHKHLKHQINAFEEPEKIILKRILPIIDKHRDYLDELISSNHSKKKTERDKLAHRQEVNFTTVNISVTATKDINVFLFNNKYFPDNIEADEVLKIRYKKMCSFIIEIINNFFDFNKYKFKGLNN